MMRTSKNKAVVSLVAGCLLAIQGCGGGGSGSRSAIAPTATTKSNTAQHVDARGASQIGAIFTTFGHGIPSPSHQSPSGPVFVSQLGLWMALSVSSNTFTETFFLDQAETKPAGSATYTLSVATKTLSGAISITQGPYAGLTGTYSQTLTKNGTTGTYAVTLPNGTNVSCQFTVQISSLGIPSGTGTETVTLTNGYTETATINYFANGSKTVSASDSNGYKSTLIFASDWSGSGTISGPDPGLPATIVWNSAGTGTVTFVDGITVNFTNWQFPTQ